MIGLNRDIGELTPTQPIGISMHKDTKYICKSVPSQASGISILIIRVVLLTGFIGSLAFAAPVNAASANDAPQQIAGDQSAPSKHMQGRDQKWNYSPRAMARHVEERIKTLREKLNITSEQEEKWNEVAQTMRNNEATIATLIKARHESVKGMNAIDDLKSYEEITEAHAEGIRNMIAVFEPLYADMSDNQKKEADEAFGRFEGHRGGMSVKKHK